MKRKITKEDKKEMKRKDKRELFRKNGFMNFLILLHGSKYFSILGIV